MEMCRSLVGLGCRVGWWVRTGEGLSSAGVSNAGAQGAVGVFSALLQKLGVLSHEVQLIEVRTALFVRPLHER